MSRRALEARLGRVAEQLAGGLRFPTGPIEGWPEEELCRLERVIEAGGAVQRAAWARLTDSDLRWAIAFWLGGAAAEEAASVVNLGPDDRQPVDPP